MTPPTVEEFAADAGAWLAEHKAEAPPDYGAICPPEHIEAAIAWQRLLNASGYAGIHWPVEHGGQGLSNEHQAAWLIECAKAGVPPVLNMVGLVLAGGALLLYGTPEQQAQHLRPTLNGDQVWCQLFSEPGAGSDLGGLTTRAERDGDRFIVNGQKVWCSGGRISGWGILMARTNPEAPKHDGISFFLCPMDLPGIEIRPLRQMTGGSEFDEVFFTDVELPADRLLGPLHGGWGVGMSVLTNERGHIGTAIISLERRLESFGAARRRARAQPGRPPAAGVADGARHVVQGAGPAPARPGRRHRHDRQLAAQAGHLRDEVRRRLAALRQRRRRRHARRPRHRRPCWPRRPAASPAAPARSSATSSASACSACRGSRARPSPDNRARSVSGRAPSRHRDRARPDGFSAAGSEGGRRRRRRSSRR